MKAMISKSPFLFLVALTVLMTGCVDSTINVKDTYDGQYGHPANLVKQVSSKNNGFYYTRTIGKESEPNSPWTGWVNTTFDFFMLDAAIELEHRDHGKYYRVHFYPKYKPTLDRVEPWVKVQLNKADDTSPIVLFAKLPNNRTLTNGTLTTDWFSCTQCYLGKEARFVALADAKSSHTDRFYYKFVATPETIPDWQGDFVLRDQQIIAEKAKAAEQKQQQLEAFEAQLPPQVLRDKYMIRLSKYLKQQQHEEALVIFPKLEALPIDTDPSMKFFYGEALLKTKQPAAALQKLYEYVNEQGSGARHYTKALEMINSAESQL